MSLERKTLRLDIKEHVPNGPDFSGAASVADVIDFHRETIDEGAFTRTLKHKKGKVPLLADHMPDRRIGIAALAENGKRLDLDGHMNLEKQLAKDTLSDIRFNQKHKVPLGLSIGFETLKEDMVDGIRHLKEIALWEVSVVTFPANPKAMVDGTKAVVPFQDLPLADRDRLWDAAAANRRVRAFTGSDDEPSNRFRRAFTWFDSENADQFGAYKLQIADVIDGRLTAVPRGIFAAAGVVQGARGGVDIPDSAMPGVRSHLGRYFRKMDLTAPWDQSDNISLELASVIEYASHINPADLSAGTRSLFTAARDSFDALLKGTKPNGDSGKAHAPFSYGPDGLSEADERQALVDDYVGFLKDLRGSA